MNVGAFLQLPALLQTNYPSTLQKVSIKHLKQRRADKRVL